MYVNNPDPNQPGGWNLSIETIKKLPTGEDLKGSETYKYLMRCFTTFDITPAQLREKASKRLIDLYNMVRLINNLLINDLSCVRLTVSRNKDKQSSCKIKELNLGRHLYKRSLTHDNLSAIFHSSNSKSLL